MNILRSFARPMLAAPFIVDGLDALVRPSRHVEKFEKVAPTLERAGLPPVLTSDARLLTRASGAVSLVAGLGLAAGRAPRTNATILAYRSGSGQRLRRKNVARASLSADGE